jgi:hypothetical protein
MSLLSYSSTWTSDTTDRTDNGVSRKRTPTMGGVNSVRKTIKVRPNYDSATDQYEVYSPSPSDSTDYNKPYTSLSETIEDVNEKQTERNTKINSILNKITSFNTDDKLGDFNPMPYPTHITKKVPDKIFADERVNNGENPLMPKVLNPLSDPTSISTPKQSNRIPTYYRASEPVTSQYASYRDAYGKEGLVGMTKEPYYSKMGISKGENGSDKVMDRLNYMTQMLESLQMEKTNHATEEFVLYCLLGVFMIYIVDGFSRGGKYVR